MPSILIRSLIFVFIEFLLFKLPGQCQSWSGYPVNEAFSQNQHYTKSSFDQNFSLVQDENGILYVANGGGVLVFDGERWDLITLDNYHYPYALGFWKNHLYVGGESEFGVLRADTLKSLKYDSFLDKLPSRFKNFGVIRNLVCNDQGCYFQSEKYIFHYQNDSIRVTESNSTYVHTAAIGADVLVAQSGEGLGRLDSNGQWAPIQGGAFFKGKNIETIIPYKEGTLLIGCENSGLFTFDVSNGRSATFKTGITPGTYQLDDIVYHQEKGLLYIGTDDQGIVVLDHQGRVVARYAAEDILPDNNVNKLYLDEKGVLWASFNTNGLMRLAVSSPVSFINLRNNFAKGDKIYQHIPAEQQLFVGTTSGVYEINKENGRLNVSKALDELQVWKMHRLKDRILIGTKSSACDYNYENGQLAKIGDSPWVLSFAVSEGEELVLVGHQGLSIFNYKNGRYILKESLEHVEFFEKIVIDGRKIWLNTHSGKIASLDLPSGKLDSTVSLSTFRIYDTESGLPSKQLVAYDIDGDLVMRVKYEKEIYTYDHDSGRFVPDPQYLERRIGAQFNGLVPISSMDSNGSIWTTVPGDQWLLMYQHRTGQSFTSYNFDRLMENQMLFSAADLFDVTDVVENTLIGRGLDGMVFVDLKGVREYDSTKYLSNVLIRSIILEGDSVLYGGFGHFSKPQLNYDFGSMRIDFASPVFPVITKKTQYQYKLGGIDKEWSKWSEKDFMEYSHLREGSYTFLVRARYDGIVTEPAKLDFIVHPPFYRSTVAYVIYLFSALLMVVLAVRLRVSNLRRKKRELEKVVAEKTKEVREQNAELFEQKQILEEQAEKLTELDKVKALFFSNITHEFKTPLTLVMAVLQKYSKQLNERAPAKLVKTDFEIANRNIHRLQLLVDQLLDLSKLTVGGEIMRPTKGDIMAFIRKSAGSFLTLSGQDDVHYSVEVDAPYVCYFDDEKLEKIIYNLLSNAFKVVTQGGQVTVTAKQQEGGVSLAVSDTGCGIPAENLDKIFDRFYRIDGTAYEGTGIGLALTKELIDFQKGEISVSSEVGKGSTFTVFLPFKKETAAAEDNPAETPELHRRDTPVSLSEVTLPSVLIVEDNADLRTFLRDSMKDNFRVFEASDGDEARDLGLKIVPDVIILDRMLGGIDGIELCAFFKAGKKTSHIPVLILTARTDTSSVIEGISRGADDYIKKPFVLEELLAKINNILRQRENLKSQWSSDLGVDLKQFVSRDQEFLAEAVRHVNENLDDPAFGVPDLQQQLGVSRMQLHRKLKELVQMSAGDFIKRLKLQRAKKLLEDNNISVSEVAYQVGFSDPSYFTKVFKKHFNIAPSELQAEENKTVD